MSSGSKRQRGNGAWELKWDLPRGLDGRRRTRTETFHGNRKQADARLRELLSQVDRGVAADAGKMTTGQWMGSWLAECKHTVAPKTWQERAGYARLHLIPALGQIPLAKLAPVHIQGYITAALTSGRIDGRGGLSAQTVRHHERVLHVALERARRLKLIATNPCDDVDPPRVERAEVLALRPDEQAQLLVTAADTWLYVPALLALASGARRSEILGLDWSNIDLDAGSMRVVQVIEQTREGGVRINPQPKSQRSRRTVTLPAAAVEVLRQYKVVQAEEHLRLGRGRPTLLFPEAADNPATFSSAFTRLARAAGIRCRFHDLRHTHVSDQLAAGVNPKVVAERVGHSNVGFLLNLYAHVTPAMQDAAAQQADITLRRALGWHQGGISSSRNS
jgi:integrase